MGKVCFKYPNQENTEEYYYIPKECFIINDRWPGANYCEEYDIIQKIQRNEDGFFDFSKNLIDIGAEDGNYAMLLDFKHNHCFEPNKRSACLLYANMYLKDKVDNTDVYTIALSEKNGTVKFDGFNCEDNKDDTPSKNIIECKTLDSFNFKNVGLIKIDVEGFEEKVIRGGLITIVSNNYPPILFECWDVGWCDMPQEKHDSLFNLMKALDYVVFEHWGDFETHLAIHKSQLEKNNQ